MHKYMALAVEPISCGATPLIMIAEGARQASLSAKPTKRAVKEPWLLSAKRL
jgi:hypothetical protein